MGFKATRLLFNNQSKRFHYINIKVTFLLLRKNNTKLLLHDDITFLY